LSVASVHFGPAVSRDRPPAPPPPACRCDVSQRLATCPPDAGASGPPERVLRTDPAELARDRTDAPLATLERRDRDADAAARSDCMKESFAAALTSAKGWQCLAIGRMKGAGAVDGAAVADGLEARERVEPDEAVVAPADARDWRPLLPAPLPPGFWPLLPSLATAADVCRTLRMYSSAAAASDATVSCPTRESREGVMAGAAGEDSCAAWPAFFTRAPPSPSSSLLTHMSSPMSTDDWRDVCTCSSPRGREA
jgi:hypothetical protein